ncbi:hypothetical protein C8R45DRAFT_505497 [Mycena sanguinolenta]|nr:hypothetical protein C8R45DRAFT_505497 [Mycena sanguinolenta]
MPSDSATEQLVDLQATPNAPFNSASMMEGGQASPGDASSDNDNSTPEDALLDPVQLEKGPKVKITLWRLLNTSLVLGLGVYKATAAYRGQEVAMTTLDWITGVFWAIIAYWVSFLEEAQLGPLGRWFFTQDKTGVVLSILTYLLVVSILFCLAGLGMGWSYAFWMGPLWSLLLFSAVALRLYKSMRRRRRAT